MRVLLLFPMADGQTGSAIKYAFEQLGHEIKAVDAKLARPSEFYRYCCEFEPDLVFCSRTHQLTEDIITIKKWFKSITICIWNVDTRTNINSWSRLFPLIELCDHHFVVNEYHVTEWNERFKTKTTWLPQGLQDEVYDKPKEITDEDRKKYSCDVSFTGGGRSLRPPFLNAVKKMNVNFKKWGCSGMPKVYNEEHNKMVSLSKVNLGISRLYGNNIDKYISVRDYKILGAGGFLLELYRKGINDIFPPDTMNDYEDPIHLLEQIAYWLNHEKERKEVAERGYKWVHKNATYTHRIKRALEIMGLK